MDFMNQVRVRFSGIGEESKDPKRVKDRRIPPRKTRSFKGEQKKGQNWFQRQFSRTTIQDYDEINGDAYPAAVAAAAFAVSSVDERKRPKERRDASLGKVKSKEEDETIPISRRTRERGESSLSQVKNEEEDEMVPISKPTTPSRKSSELQEKKVSFRVDVDEKAPDKADIPVPNTANTELKDEGKRKTTGSVPSVKKNPTFSEKLMERTTSSKIPESEMPEASASHLPTEPQELPPTEVKRQSITKPGFGDSKADVWEETELERIKRRYEKLKAKIAEWEKEKKDKAKKKMTRHEGELERKRARVLQDYKSTIEMIDHIAAGARSQAEKNQRKEEIKVKEKANKIRSTGKIPTATCFCC